MALELILSSHGLYAQEALKSVEMIIGQPRMNVQVVSVTEGRTYDDCLAELSEKYQSIESRGNEVLILVDIFGGTPSNIASYLALTKENIQVYSGFNMPVLLELIAVNPQSLMESKEIIENAYNNSFIDISKKMKEGVDNGDQAISY